MRAAAKELVEDGIFKSEDEYAKEYFSLQGGRK
jgi:hypothetical protein